MKAKQKVAVQTLNGETKKDLEPQEEYEDPVVVEIRMDYTKDVCQLKKGGCAHWK